MTAYITQVSNAGKHITLSDGTAWIVSTFDAFKTMMWMVTENVTVSGNTLTNTQRNESVTAQRG